MPQSPASVLLVIDDNEEFVRQCVEELGAIGEPVCSRRSATKLLGRALGEYPNSTIIVLQDVNLGPGSDPLAGPEQVCPAYFQGCFPEVLERCQFFWTSGMRFTKEFGGEATVEHFPRKNLDAIRECLKGTCNCRSRKN